MATIPRRDYAAIYGPTRGDLVRLADSDLLAEIETAITNANSFDLVGQLNSLPHGTHATKRNSRDLETCC